MFSTCIFLKFFYLVKNIFNALKLTVVLVYILIIHVNEYTYIHKIKIRTQKIKVYANRLNNTK